MEGHHGAGKFEVLEMVSSYFYTLVLGMCVLISLL